MTVTKGDIVSMIDVLTELTNDCDELDVAEVLALHELLGQLQSEVKRADSFIDTTVKRRLEAGAQRVGDRDYALKPKGTWDYHHDQVAAEVIRRSVADLETGEMREARDVATEAVRLMRSLYVMPSTAPNQTSLAMLGMAKEEVAAWRKTGTRVVVTDVGAPKGAT